MRFESKEDVLKQFKKELECEMLELDRARKGVIHCQEWVIKQEKNVARLERMITYWEQYLESD